jgi:hypothetical protein
MLAELREDNQDLTSRLREAHNVCDERCDVTTASLIEVWIDESERRICSPFEAGGRADSSGHLMRVRVRPRSGNHVRALLREGGCLARAVDDDGRDYDDASPTTAQRNRRK